MVADPGADALDHLWWPSHKGLWELLDEVNYSHVTAEVLTEKLKAHHHWLLHGTSNFKSPNEASRRVIEGSSFILKGKSYQVKAALRNPALLVSKVLQLDQVQSYILLVRLLSTQNHPEDATTAQDGHIRLSPAQQIAVWGDGGTVARAMSLYFLERTCLISSQFALVKSAALVEDQLSPVTAGALAEQLRELVDGGLPENFLSQLAAKLQEDTLPEALLRSGIGDADRLLSVWHEQQLQEQLRLLECLILLFYDEGKAMACGTLVSLLKTLGRHVFCTKPQVLYGELSGKMQGLLRCRGHLAVLLILEGFNLEALVEAIRFEQSLEECESTFTVSELKDIAVALETWSTNGSQQSSQADHCGGARAFVLLAWAVYLSLASKLPNKPNEGDDLPDTQKALAATDTSDAMRFWTSMVCEGEIFESKGHGHTVAYLSLVKNFLSMFLSAFQANDSALSNTLACLLGRLLSGQPTLCDGFWEGSDDLELPLHALLNTVRSHFPLQVLPLFNLLGSAMCTEFSAQSALFYLHRLPNVTWLHRYPALSIARHGNDLVTLEEPVELHIGSIEELLLPAGTEGRIVPFDPSKSMRDGLADPEDIRENHVCIEWQSPCSGIALLLSMLVASVDVAEQRGMNDNDAEMILACMKLLTAIFAHARVAANIVFKVGNGNEFLRAIVAASRLAAASAEPKVPLLCEVLKCITAMSEHSPGHALEALTSLSILTDETEYTSANQQLYPVNGRLPTAFYQIHVSHELPSRKYPLTFALMDAIRAVLRTETVFPLSRTSQYEVFKRCVFLIAAYVFPSYKSWAFASESERWTLCLSATETLRQCLQLAPTTHPLFARHSETRHQYSQNLQLSSVARELLTQDASVCCALVQLLLVDAGRIKKFSEEGARYEEVMAVEGSVEAAMGLLHDLLHIAEDDDEHNEVAGEIERNGAGALSSNAGFEGSTTVRAISLALSSFLDYHYNDELQMMAFKALGSLCMSTLCSRALPVKSIGKSLSVLLENTLMAETDVERNSQLCMNALRLIDSILTYAPENAEALLAPLEEQKTSTSPSCMEVLCRFVQSKRFQTRQLHISSAVVGLLISIWDCGLECSGLQRWIRSQKGVWKALADVVEGRSQERQYEHTETEDWNDGLDLAWRLSTKARILRLFSLELMAYGDSKPPDEGVVPIVTKWLNSDSACLKELVDSCTELAIVYNPGLVRQTCSSGQALVLRLMAAMASSDDASRSVAQGLAIGVHDEVEELARDVLRGVGKELHQGVASLLVAASSSASRDASSADGISGVEASAEEERLMTSCRRCVVERAVLKSSRAAKTGRLVPTYGGSFLFDREFLGRVFVSSQELVQGELDKIMKQLDSLVRRSGIAASVADAKLALLQSLHVFLAVTNFDSTKQGPGLRKILWCMKDEQVESMVDTLSRSISASFSVVSADAHGFTLAYLQCVAPLYLLIARLHFRSASSESVQAALLEKTLHVVKSAYDDLPLDVREGPASLVFRTILTATLWALHGCGRVERGLPGLAQYQLALLPTLSIDAEKHNSISVLCKCLVTALAELDVLGSTSSNPAWLSFVLDNLSVSALRRGIDVSLAKYGNILKGLTVYIVGSEHLDGSLSQYAALPDELELMGAKVVKHGSIAPSSTPEMKAITHLLCLYPLDPTAVKALRANFSQAFVLDVSWALACIKESQRVPESAHAAQTSREALQVEGPVALAHVVADARSTRALRSGGTLQTLLLCLSLAKIGVAARRMVEGGVIVQLIQQSKLLLLEIAPGTGASYTYQQRCNHIKAMEKGGSLERAHTMWVTVLKLIGTLLKTLGRHDELLAQVIQFIVTHRSRLLFALRLSGATPGTEGPVYIGGSSLPDGKGVQKPLLALSILNEAESTLFLLTQMAPFLSRWSIHDADGAHLVHHHLMELLGFLATPQPVTLCDAGHDERPRKRVEERGDLPSIGSGWFSSVLAIGVEGDALELQNETLAMWFPYKMYRVCWAASQLLLALARQNLTRIQEHAAEDVQVGRKSSDALGRAMAMHVASLPAESTLSGILQQCTGILSELASRSSGAKRSSSSASPTGSSLNGISGTSTTALAVTGPVPARGWTLSVVRCVGGVLQATLALEAHILLHHSMSHMHAAEVQQSVEKAMVALSALQVDEELVQGVNQCLDVLKQWIDSD